MKLRRNERGFSHIVGLALLVLVVGVIGFIGWRVHNLHSGRPAATTTSKDSNNTPPIPLVDKTSAGIVATVKKRLAAKYTIVSGSAITSSTVIKVGTLYYNEDTRSPAWKPAGAAYYVYVTDGHAIGGSIHRKNDVVEKADTAGISAVIKGVLSDAGLTEGQHVAIDPGLGDTVTYYTSSDVVCDIDNDTYLDCAQLADYPAAYTAAKPFADLYLAQNPDQNPGGDAAFGVPDIKDSKTPGYQIATVSAPNVEALYYSKNGVWHYWASSQDELGCREYNTADLRLAYAGQPCYDETAKAESTVQ